MIREERGQVTVPQTLVNDEPLRDELFRIAHSETLNSSPGLVRLLEHIARKSMSGEIDALKEYSIGVEAFGKPESYDPQRDPYVRIRVGRLRGKLAEYYSKEGRNDPVIVELPKGKFRLIWSHVPDTNAIPLEPAPKQRRLPALTALLASVLVLVTIWALWATLELRKSSHETVLTGNPWSNDLQTLWAPFLVPGRPLLISLEAPLFLSFPKAGMFRDLSVNSPEEVAGSRNLAAIRKALGVEGRPQTYYTPVGEVSVVFKMGMLLATRKANLSITKSSDLTWKQISENNVLSLGTGKALNQQLASMPVKVEFESRWDGIHNLNPRAGEAGTYLDEISFSGGEQDGMIYALISHLPGPRGYGDVQSFASSLSAGRIAALQGFTDPEEARRLVNRIRNASGQIPRYYQVLLKVRFRAGVPIETSYVLHRALIVESR
jgi:hypothetical protein